LILVKNDDILYKIYEMGNIMALRFQSVVDVNELVNKLVEDRLIQIVAEKSAAGVRYKTRALPALSQHFLVDTQGYTYSAKQLQALTSAEIAASRTLFMAKKSKPWPLVLVVAMLNDAALVKEHLTTNLTLVDMLEGAEYTANQYWLLNLPSCPIAYTPIQTACISHSGRSYEKPAFDSYVLRQDPTRVLLDPFSRQPLTLEQLVPNVALQDLINIRFLLRLDIFSDILEEGRLAYFQAIQHVPAIQDKNLITLQALHAHVKRRKKYTQYLQNKKLVQTLDKIACFLPPVLMLVFAYYVGPEIKDRGRPSVREREAQGAFFILVMLPLLALLLYLSIKLSNAFHQFIDRKVLILKKEAAEIKIAMNYLQHLELSARPKMDYIVGLWKKERNALDEKMQLLQTLQQAAQEAIHDYPSLVYKSLEELQVMQAEIVATLTRQLFANGIAVGLTLLTYFIQELLGINSPQLLLIIELWMAYTWFSTELLGQFDVRSYAYENWCLLSSILAVKNYWLSDPQRQAVYPSTIAAIDQKITAILALPAAGLITNTLPTHYFIERQATHLPSPRALRAAAAAADLSAEQRPLKAI
jgi:hypothetical protein